MKYLLLLLVLLLPLSALAVSGQQAKFDFSNGQPEITADATSDCTDTAKARFEFTQGLPDIALDATANCTLATAIASGAAYKVELPVTYKLEIPAGYLMIVQ